MAIVAHRRTAETGGTQTRMRLQLGAGLPPIDFRQTAACYRASMYQIEITEMSVDDGPTVQSAPPVPENSTAPQHSGRCHGWAKTLGCMVIQIVANRATLYQPG